MRTKRPQSRDSSAESIPVGTKRPHRRDRRDSSPDDSRDSRDSSSDESRRQAKNVQDNLIYKKCSVAACDIIS